MAELAQELERHLPHAAAKIQRLTNDPTLRDMLREYEEGVQFLSGDVSTRGGADNRTSEYIELVNDLQQEILSYLLNHEPQ